MSIGWTLTPYVGSHSVLLWRAGPLDRRHLKEGSSDPDFKRNGIARKMFTQCGAMAAISHSSRDRYFN
jgi:hypothetical protein